MRPVVAQAPAVVHTRAMETFHIVPRGKKYWVEAVGEDGARKSVVAFATEEAALQCLRSLQHEAEAARRPVPSATRT
jgi:hypothetical protein